jgi:hypothetical protein
MIGGKASDEWVKFDPHLFCFILLLYFITQYLQLHAICLISVLLIVLLLQYLSISHLIKDNVLSPDSIF